MPSQLNKLALTNPDTLSETLTFSIFQEGAEESSRQVISIEDNEAIIENNRPVITSKVYNLTAVGVYSASARTQLETWKNASTEVNLSGYGLDKSILQGSGVIQPKLGTDENLSHSFSSPREAKGGYNSDTGKHSADLIYCTNGLALYKWQEGSTANLAAGWTKTGGSTTWDDVNGEQDFSTTGASAVYLTRDIYFPFAGQDLTFFIDVEAVTSTTGLYVGIQAFDNTDSEIGSESTNAFSSTGVASVTREVPANTEYVKVRVKVGQDDSVSFKDPSLQLDDTYSFVEFNT